MDNLIKKIAGKLNIDEEIVEKAVRSEFKFVAEAMQSGEFQSVHLHYWGKFAVKNKSIERLNTLKEFYDKQRI